MDPLETAIKQLDKHGWWAVAGGCAVVLAIRLGQPSIVGPAVGRVYGDICQAIRAWWATHQELVHARRDAAREAATRDRNIAAAYAAHQEELSQGGRRRGLVDAGRNARRTGQGGRRLAALEDVAEAVDTDDPGDGDGGRRPGAGAGAATRPRRRAE